MNCSKCPWKNPETCKICKQDEEVKKQEGSADNYDTIGQKYQVIRR